MLEYRCDCSRIAILRRWPTTLRCSCGAVVEFDDHGNSAVVSEGDYQPRWVAGSPCQHRVAKIREMEGHCCGGRQIVDVFECSIHGECTYRNTKAGKDKPQPCLGCVDHESPSV